MTKILEEANQSNTSTICANDILKGKIPLDELPEPYVIIEDNTRFDSLTKVVNILAIKKGYWVVSSFSISQTFQGYVIMEKKSNNK
jgi:hypothetical protein